MSNASTPRRPRLPVSSTARRLLWVALGLTALLAMVAVASRYREFRSGTSSSSPSPALVVDYLATLMLIAMPIGAALVILALVESRRQRALAQRSSRRATLVMLLGLAAFCLAVAFGAPRLREAGFTLRLPELSRALVSASEDSPESQRTTQFRWDAVIVLGSILGGIAIAIVVTGRRRRRLLASGPGAFEELTLALDESLDDLRRERDPRRAVIAAYARMEAALAVHGLPRHRAEAPLEYLARVLLDLHASERAVRRLTDLFEKAKFSAHEIDAEMKQEAIVALEGLRDDLRAIHAPDPPPLARRPGAGRATA
ncbi:MAG: DUF4129 domain-containing protein [Actinomycetota bacterium]|nr:DUF4129 domain-containing protein [Actinomycetota bacterium]